MSWIAAGVGKSRFIHEAAKKAEAHILRTTFEYGVLKSVINEADSSTYHDVSAIMEIWLLTFMLGQTMVIIMDEAHCMGPPPASLRTSCNIHELISKTKKIYSRMEYIDDEVTPMAKHFVSVALHLVLQEVALAWSGLTTFTFCQDVRKTLPYFSYDDVKAVVGQYINLGFYSLSSTEVTSVIAQLTGPPIPRITEIFLETCWQKQGTSQK
ncbi:8107_t:CDS:2 [Paraglomus brasilianum]|uniref:8107_t:CDS:1 n=1 Tax=Paraglomus brasilianum TaxID=144538 RepID=A0A9N9CN04_9GLOM|nr:8107_t:CDS:2 [Paraglomus brasilianum]